MLDLHNNRIIGTIPDSVLQLPSLSTVILRNNKIDEFSTNITGTSVECADLRLNTFAMFKPNAICESSNFLQIFVDLAYDCPCCSGVRDDAALMYSPLCQDTEPRFFLPPN
uniref:Uncharacterized protein n=1 Tax=Cyclophora tenuis TaxID=216820 RepID=A0A7S1CX73_CYCTE|mmetsp:Transcript_10939/g.18534  ORF Transcript_10939/g.18534 Transcript_10939/m.18534 type:complete len:111 (+) Transcript_10939:639-971(+)